MQPFMRVSDADRQDVVDILQEHTAAGRLSLNEFTARVDAANRAVTHADLVPLTADLPTPVPAVPPVRRWPTGLVVAGIVLALLLVVALVAGLTSGMHMGPMMRR